MAGTPDDSIAPWITATPTEWLENARAAGTLLDGVARRTPIELSRRALIGSPTALKCENMQCGGSFKIRGAYVRIARMPPDQRDRGVVAASAGNHAQGVALAAGLLGTRATVFMPRDASLPKVAATRGYGADVRLVGHSVDEALVAAQEYAAQTGAAFIHPFDHPDVIAGQATVGIEILEQYPDVRTIVVSAGGGGLAAGIAVVVRALRPDVRVVAVQAQQAAALAASVRAGHPIALSDASTMADGIAVRRPGSLTLPLVSRYVDEIRTVSEEAIAHAVLACLERAKLVVEPAGAAALAAVMDDSSAFPSPVVAVLSGGNVDPIVLLRILRHGLAAAGRYLTFHVTLPDRPGALAALLTALAAVEANVLDVVHERTQAALAVDEVEVALQVETRGQEHSQEVLETVARLGYAVS
ncbi:L-threonine ammonia-lyase [Acidothermus cellulolyticus 11B]|uniref:L-threonine dehydratase catabolic TdcB n=1 Tax=Acidothermus cellulolyticus (strain ATCC 43068 / DSM 8971 / 11B) TaxID=351607 RepID=A0LW50_ACIC1|nr:threonine ammonia-lyase [Acidothermus cellulolyticus]ABK53660.1 L-threonine ammonia-lyase [Acidothermus cellulolyticus 11B]